MLNAKEESLAIVEKQLDDYKIKYKQAVENAERCESQLRESEKNVAELQAIRDDIESKVNLYLLLVVFFLSLSNCFFCRTPIQIYNNTI
jgi:hypothetical protein